MLNVTMVLVQQIGIEKANNVIGPGLKIQTKYPSLFKEIIIAFMRQKLEIEVKMYEVYKPCFVKLENRNEKQKIMPNKCKPKTTKGEIYIYNNRT